MRIILVALTFFLFLNTGCSEKTASLPPKNSALDDRVFTVEKWSHEIVTETDQDNETTQDTIADTKEFVRHEAIFDGSKMIYSIDSEISVEWQYEITGDEITFEKGFVSGEFDHIEVTFDIDDTEDGKITLTISEPVVVTQDIAGGVIERRKILNKWDYIFSYK